MNYLSYQGNNNNNGGNFMVTMIILTLLMLFAPYFMGNPLREPQPTMPANETTNPVADAPVIRYPMATRTLESAQITVAMTNAGGGRPNSVFIKDPDRYAQHGEFIRSQKQDTPEKAGLLPLAVELPSFGITAETQFDATSPESDTRSASFFYMDPTAQMRFAKTFSVSDDKPYIVHAKFDISNLTANDIKDELSMSLFIKQIKEEEPGLFTPGSFVAAKCFADDSLEYLDATDKDEAESFTKDIKWFAVDESYFAIAVGVQNARQCDVINDDGLLKSVVHIPVSIAKNTTQTLEFDIYFGPKESRYLDNLGPDADLHKIIDYGWIEVIAKPMAWILDKFQALTGNWGVAIIILTIIIRLLLWPIAQKSQLSMMRMSKIAPLMQELQEKYKDDQATLAQKQMELYKEQNINPFGCLPLFLQMPVFFALYRCIFVTGGLYHAPFVLWIDDLSARDPYFILPILGVALLVIQQKLTPTATQNKQQKIMMITMPILFGAMMLFLPSGLCLYMVVSSTFSMAQSFYVRRIIAKEDADNANGVEVLSPDPSTSKDRRAAKRRNAD